MAIDTDGKPENNLNDKTQRRCTSYQFKAVKKLKRLWHKKIIDDKPTYHIDLDASQKRYVVVPTSDKKIANGDIAMVIDRKKRKYLYAIVGDRGTPENGYKECSVSVAWTLGYYDADGSNGPEGKFETVLLPNTNKKGGKKWKYSTLNSDLRIAGEKIRKKRKINKLVKGCTLIR